MVHPSRATHPRFGALAVLGALPNLLHLGMHVDEVYHRSERLSLAHDVHVAVKLHLTSIPGEEDGDAGPEPVLTVLLQLLPQHLY